MKIMHISFVPLPLLLLFCGICCRIQIMNETENNRNNKNNNSKKENSKIKLFIAPKSLTCTDSTHRHYLYLSERNNKRIRRRKSYPLSLFLNVFFVYSSLFRELNESFIIDILPFLDC